MQKAGTPGLSFVGISAIQTYSVIEGRGVDGVKSRIMGVLFSNEIPDPRDVMISVWRTHEVLN